MPYINEVLDTNKRTNEEEKTRQAQKVASRYLFDPDKITTELKSLIVGQDEVIDQLGDLLLRVKADITEPNKPLLVAMLLGPTGVGKTQLVNHLTRLILGNENKVCRIDMNTLAQSHYSAAVTGAPPGYAGSKENHTLLNTDAITGSYSRPGIVLFDEIEKASVDVCRSLLNVLDNAKLTLSSGNKTIDFSNSLIFMTTNLGSDALLNQNHDKSTIFAIKKLFNSVFKSKKSNQIKAFSSLEQHFDPEFINRLESFLYFNPINDDNLSKLILLECTYLNKRVKHANCTFKFTPACIAALKKDYQQRYGARNIRHRIRCDIEPLVARLILDGQTNSKNYEVDWIKTFYLKQI